MKVHGGGLYLIADQSTEKDPAEVRYVLYGVEGRTTISLEPDGRSEGQPTFSLEGAESIYDLKRTLSPDTKTEAGAPPEIPDLRFYSRLVPLDSENPAALQERQLKTGTLKQIADQMLGGGVGDATGNARLPAAYTYFGQFIAHDLAKTKFTVQPDGRTIAVNCAFSTKLDFKTIFGLHEDFIGDTSEWQEGRDSYLGLAQPASDESYTDLPREPSGKPATRDGRSDANLAVSQMHVMLVHFHWNLNKSLAATDTEGSKRQTTRFLQSVVLHDYLKRLIKTEVYEDVMAHGRRYVVPDARQGNGDAFQVPVEFSVACFRFGHSMVAGKYKPWNDIVPQRTIILDYMLHYAFNPQSLITPGDAHDGLGTDHRSVPKSWGTNWRSMLATIGATQAQVVANPIGTSLLGGMGDLPNRLLPPNEQSPSGAFSLPLKTLERGKALGLPTAQQLHKDVKGALSGSMSENTLGPVMAGPDISGPLAPEVGENTPLWFYTLREAEKSGGKLGDLCGRIVMETLHAAIELAEHSIIERDEDGRSVVSGSVSQKSLLDVVNIAYPLNP